MKEGNTDYKNSDNQQLTLENLYKIALQKIREYVNPQPFTSKKIKELLRILATSAVPLRYTEIVNACSKQRCFMKWNNKTKKYESSREAVKKFIKRYLKLLIIAGIVEKVNGEEKGYRLRYSIKPLPLPAEVGKIIENKKKKFNGSARIKMKIFDLFIDLLELKGYLDVTENYNLIPSIHFIIFELRKEVENLKQFVEGSHQSIQLLGRICNTLEELRETYLKVQRTQRRDPAEDELFEKLSQLLDKLHLMPIGGVI